MWAGILFVPGHNAPPGPARRLHGVCHAGSCRQSVNAMSGAPSRAMRQHSASHSMHHMVQLRWSLASLSIGGYRRFVPLCWYFWAGSACRAPRVTPPLEYGGSVKTASMAASGKVARIPSASPWYSVTPSFRQSFITVRSVLAVGRLGAGAHGPHDGERPTTGALKLHFAGLAFGQELAATATSDFFEFFFPHGG